MRKLIYFIVIIAAALLLGSCNKFKKPITEENVEYTDTVEQYEYVPTVGDVLQERANIKYALWVDSVYLNMPEQILTQMLVHKGTTLSIEEIVEDYVANKQFYHDTILKTMNIQKKYIPDSLPPTSKQNKKLNNCDTINKINNP